MSVKFISLSLCHVHLTLILGLNKAIRWLPIGSSACCYGRILEIEIAMTVNAS